LIDVLQNMLSNNWYIGSTSKFE